jgi:hypothetical protein
MEAAPWREPLAGIAILPHPTPSTAILSSALSDPNAFRDQRGQTCKLLELYVPNNEGDDTVTILWHAICNVPNIGSLQLVSEILEIGRDHEKLRELRNFFVNPILKPSIHTYIYIYIYSRIINLFAVIIIYYIYE